MVVAWPDCLASDPALDAAAKLIRGDALLSQGFERVLASSDFVKSLESLNPGETEAVSPQKLRGIGIGLAGEGYIIASFKPDSPVANKLMIERLTTVVAGAASCTEEEVILAGEPYQVTLIDKSSRETIRRYVLPSSLLALMIAWMCLGSWRLTITVFAFAGIGQAIGLSLIAAWLGEMSAVLVVLPTLVFMLTLSAAIHLANYYAESADEQGMLAAPQPENRAMGRGWKPCVLATLTTAFGFASLATSSVKPVKDFGALASAGTLVSTFILLMGFPALVWLVHRLVRRQAGLQPKATRQGLFASSVEGRFVNGLASVVSRYPTLVSMIGVVLFVVMALGVPRLRTSTEFTDMFSEGSKAVRDLKWVTEHIGPIATLDVVVAISTETDTIVQVNQVAALAGQLKELKQVEQCRQATVFLPSPPGDSGIRGTFARSIYRRKVTAALGSMEQLVHDADGSRLWKLSLRLSGLRNENYQETVDTITRVCESAGFEQRGLSNAASGADAQGQGGVAEQLLAEGQFVVTGMRSVIETAHTALLRDLGTSFLAAFLLITPVMMLITRSFLGGLLLMLPNTLPVAVVFGAMGWLGIQLDVASILTASVALGIAVDDTLHFVVCYRRQLAAGQPNENAVQIAMSSCGPPMMHTTLICAGAMFPFLFCDFLPTSKFSLLMILILSGAILGDLILLPALLLSRLTKFIRPNSPQAQV